MEQSRSTDELVLDIEDTVSILMMFESRVHDFKKISTAELMEMSPESSTGNLKGLHVC